MKQIDAIFDLPMQRYSPNNVKGKKERQRSRQSVRHTSRKKRKRKIFSAFWGRRTRKRERENRVCVHLLFISTRVVFFPSAPLIFLFHFRCLKAQKKLHFFSLTTYLHIHLPQCRFFTIH